MIAWAENRLTFYDLSLAEPQSSYWGVITGNILAGSKVVTTTGGLPNFVELCDALWNVLPTSYDPATQSYTLLQNTSSLRVRRPRGLLKKFSVRLEPVIASGGGNGNGNGGGNDSYNATWVLADYETRWFGEVTNVTGTWTSNSGWQSYFPRGNPSRAINLGPHTIKVYSHSGVFKAAIGPNETLVAWSWMNQTTIDSEPDGIRHYLCIEGQDVSGEAEINRRIALYVLP
ncbi:MAG: hypothetical protein HC893_03550 [Chloroflexaceae bacterium]|nr:hypothetical protein [Chloroflexaceae bacterium]